MSIEGCISSSHLHSAFSIIWLPYSTTYVYSIMWQAEADKELTLFDSPASAVGQSKLALANLG